MRQLSDGGWESLVAHGIRTVVDLRGHDERADDPPAELPVEIVHVPFFESTQAEWQELTAELDAAVEAAPDGPAATVATAPEGGVLVHCAGGKDRTGLLSAFLLHLAGVDDDEIAADYALSEKRLRPRHEARFAAAETEEEVARLRRIARTPPESMAGVFAELEARYGGVEEYLRAAGVTDEELRLVRARLRG